MLRNITLFLIIFMTYGVISYANLTPNKIPVDKQGSNPPQLQDGDITDLPNTSVNISVPVNVNSITASSVTSPLIILGGVGKNTWPSATNNVNPGTIGREAVYATSGTVNSGIIADNGTTVAIGGATTVQGNPVCTTGSVCTGYQTSLNLTPGTYINGGICSQSGGTLNCTTSSSGLGSVTSVGIASPNLTIQSVGGTNPVTGSGTINLDFNWTDINAIAAMNTGGLNWASLNSIAKMNQGGINWANLNSVVTSTGINWSTLNGVVNSAGINWNNINGLDPINYGGINWLSIPNYAVGKILTATTANSVNWAIASSGSGNGTVTNVFASLPVVSSGGTSPYVSFNWTDVNSITDGMRINMRGVNWYDAQNLNQGINWYQVPLVTNSNQTTGTGSGFVQLWNSAHTFFLNQSVNSGITGSSGINWSQVPALANEIPETGDAFGDINWVNASAISGGSGTVNSGTAGQIPYYATSSTTLSPLTTSAYTSTYGLALTASGSGGYGFTAVDTNSADFALNFVKNDQGYEGGIIETGSAYAIPNVFAVGTFDNHPIDFLINQSPVGQIDTGGDLGIGITNPSYYNYENGQQMIDVNNQEFQANFVSTVSAYGGGISIGQDTGAAVVNGARIGKIEFSGPTDNTGFNGNAYSSAGIAAYATQNWSGSATGSQLVLQTTPNGSTTRTTVLTLGQSGSMTLANASSHSGQATCWTTSGQIGYCTGAVSGSGSCSCTGL